MKRALVPATVAACVLAVAWPAAASAQAVLFGGDGFRTVDLLLSPVRPSGLVTVSFHGDEASGCVAAHLCGVSGTVTWKPSGVGLLFAYGMVEGGQRLENGFLTFGDDVSGAPTATSARVRRADNPDALCADAGVPTSIANAVPRPGSSVAVSLTGSPGTDLAGAELLRTRCAGPMTADVASLLPVRSIGKGAMRRGGAKLDFSADGSFAAHGLAGTLHSTLVLRVGRARSEGGGGGGGGGRTQTIRTRFLEIDYRIEHASGQVATAVAGLSDPDLCGPLDACGLMGTVTLAPQASGGQGYVIAYGSARHSVRELRRALGLVPGPRPRGVRRAGFLSWDHDGGSVTSDLSRAGEPACADSAPVAGGGSVELGFAGSRIGAGYAAGFLGGADPLQTRCPGPNAGDVSGGNQLATGHLPLQALRGGRLTIRLTNARGYSSDGYSGTSRSDLTIVARRTGIRTRVQTDHVPAGFPGQFFFARQLARRRLP